MEDMLNFAYFLNNSKFYRVVSYSGESFVIAMFHPAVSHRENCKIIHEEFWETLSTVTSMQIKDLSTNDTLYSIFFGGKCVSREVTKLGRAISVCVSMARFDFKKLGNLKYKEV